MSHIAEIIVHFVRFTLAFLALALCMGSTGQAQDRSPGTVSNLALTDRSQTSFLTPLQIRCFCLPMSFVRARPVVMTEPWGRVHRRPQQI